MTDYKIEAKTREESGRKARQAGLIPAVVYGNGFKNINVALEKFAFQNLFREAGSSNLVDLSVDGQKSLKTLIHDIQIDPITSEIIHTDFLKVNMKEKIHAEIPLNFINESPAVVEREGSLITSKDAIEVECLPGDLVPKIDVDLAALTDFEIRLHVGDLQIPAGIEVLDDPEEIVAYVEAPRSEEELEALEQEVVEDVSKVEVEAEKKEEEGEEAKQAEKEEK